MATITVLTVAAVLAFFAAILADRGAVVTARWLTAAAAVAAAVAAVIAAAAGGGDAVSLAGAAPLGAVAVAARNAVARMRHGDSSPSHALIFELEHVHPKTAARFARERGWYTATGFWEGNAATAYVATGTANEMRALAHWVFDQGERWVVLLDSRNGGTLVPSPTERENDATEQRFDASVYLPLRKGEDAAELLARIGELGATLLPDENGEYGLFILCDSAAHATALRWKYASMRGEVPDAPTPATYTHVALISSIRGVSPCDAPLGTVDEIWPPVDPATPTEELVRGLRQAHHTAIQRRVRTTLCNADDTLNRTVALVDRYIVFYPESVDKRIVGAGFTHWLWGLIYGGGPTARVLDAYGAWAERVPDEYTFAVEEAIRRVVRSGSLTVEEEIKVRRALGAREIKTYVVEHARHRWDAACLSEAEQVCVLRIARHRWDGISPLVVDERAIRRVCNQRPYGAGPAI